MAETTFVINVYGIRVAGLTNAHKPVTAVGHCLRQINSLRAKNNVKMKYENGCHTNTSKDAAQHIQRCQLRSGSTRTCYVTLLMAGKDRNCITRLGRLNGTNGQCDE